MAEGEGPGIAVREGQVNQGVKTGKPPEKPPEKPTRYFIKVSDRGHYERWLDEATPLSVELRRIQEKAIETGGTNLETGLNRVLRVANLLDQNPRKRENVLLTIAANTHRLVAETDELIKGIAVLLPGNEEERETFAREKPESPFTAAIVGIWAFERARKAINKPESGVIDPGRARRAEKNNFLVKNDCLTAVQMDPETVAKDDKNEQSLRWTVANLKKLTRAASGLSSFVGRLKASEITVSPPFFGSGRKSLISSEVYQAALSVEFGSKLTADYAMALAAMADKTRATREACEAGEISTEKPGEESLEFFRVRSLVGENARRLEARSQYRAKRQEFKDAFYGRVLDEERLSIQDIKPEIVEKARQIMARVIAPRISEKVTSAVKREAVIAQCRADVDRVIQSGIKGKGESGKEVVIQPEGVFHQGSKLLLKLGQSLFESGAMPKEGQIDMVLVAAIAGQALKEAQVQQKARGSHYTFTEADFETTDVKLGDHLCSLAATIDRLGDGKRLALKRDWEGMKSASERLRSPMQRDLETGIDRTGQALEVLIGGVDLPAEIVSLPEMTPQEFEKLSLTERRERNRSLQTAFTETQVAKKIEDSRNIEQPVLSGIDVAAYA